MLTLDNKSVDYMKSVNVPVTSPTALEAAAATALTKLSIALQYGEAVDPDLVHFLVDYHDDSYEKLDSFKKFLYDPGTGGTPSRVSHYLETLGKPVTQALAPLLTKLALAPNEAALLKNLNTGLANGASLNLPPPVLALNTLGASGLPVSGVVPASTGQQQAKIFAEAYLTHATVNERPIDQAVLDA